MAAALPDGGTALLQALLAAEHAAVYGYGVLGARLDETRRAQALLDTASHRTSRNALTALLRRRGAAAPATLAAYDLVVGSPQEAVTAAVRLEEGLAVRWRDLVGGTDDADLRRLGVDGLRSAAVRAVRWRRAAGSSPGTVALPGVAP